jgi:hypothetical protein
MNARATFGPSFRNMFCARFRCQEKDFVNKVLWRCLYPHAAPFILLFCDRHSPLVKQTVETIEEAGFATSAEDVLTSIENYHYTLRFFGSFWNRTFKIRLSGRRLLKLYSTVTRDRAVEPIPPCVGTETPSLVSH